MDRFPSEVVEAMKRDLEELLGERVRIRVTEPNDFFGPWGWEELFGRVVSQYVDYEGHDVLEIDLDLEVDWERGKAKQVVVRSRYLKDRYPGGYYPCWEGRDLLSLLEGKELTVNVFVTKHRLSTKPAEKPDMVAIGIIRVIEKESWLRTEEDKRIDEKDGSSGWKKHRPEKKMGWRNPRAKETVIRIWGDFNRMEWSSIAGQNAVILNIDGNRDLDHVRHLITDGLRVVIDDGDFEAEGILEFTGKYWRALILEETGRWFEPCYE